MATEQVQPSGIGTNDQWSLAAGASKVAAVALPDDDLTSYLSSSTTINRQQDFTCTPSTLAVGDTVTEVIVSARLKGNTQTVAYNLIYSFAISGGGTQTGTSTGLNQGPAAWGTDTYTDTGLSVVYGGSLTVSIINTQARDLFCSSLYLDITFTPAGGGSTQPPRTMHQFRMKNK